MSPSGHQMMQHSEKQLSVTWRGKTFVLEMDQSAKLKDLGDRLQNLTNVKVETLRLIVPAKKGSKLLYPFSDEHSNLPLDAASTLEVSNGKSIRMMGVPESEVDEILQSGKKDLRIAGFDEEEKRMRHRALYDRNFFVQLPQGTYVFAEFRTLSIPGIELNPSASEALKLMHRLAADFGIVAIMNKHRWRVGIMTEMAPVGYVGVSPKCILGFNKNHGEEISLRLRTDDLKGFRKYESIKMTLVHELAHMVYSEHDANFYALDKQLNKEAASLDWTKSKGHTINGVRPPLHYEEKYSNSVTALRTLGGQESGLSSVRASSVAAAYRRFPETSVNVMRASDESTDAGASLELVQVQKGYQNEIEYHPDLGECMETNDSKSCPEFGESQIIIQPDDDCSEGLQTEENEVCTSSSLVVLSKDSRTMEIEGNSNQPEVILVEPDPDDSQSGDYFTKHKKMSTHLEAMESLLLMGPPYREPDPDDLQASIVVKTDIVPDENGMVVSMDQSAEPDPDDQELQRIQDPVTTVYSHLQKAMDVLRSEVDLLNTAPVLQTLLKIIQNVIEHPDELKFRKVRKANPTIQRNILRYGAAKKILHLVGFGEDAVVDEMGKAETYLVLKRNDPGLLWLVKSSLENYNA